MGVKNPKLKKKPQNNFVQYNFNFVVHDIIIIPAYDIKNFNQANRPSDRTCHTFIMHKVGFCDFSKLLHWS